MTFDGEIVCTYDRRYHVSHVTTLWNASKEMSAFTNPIHQRLRKTLKIIWGQFRILSNLRVFVQRVEFLSGQSMFSD